ncbi:YbaY family lipoprotein [Onishia taeanensis]
MTLTRPLLIAAALTGTLALAGCDNADDTEQAAENPSTSQTEQPQEVEQQASRTLEGKLQFSATETPLPTEAEVTVSLKDVATTQATLITETTVVPEAGEPVEFTLAYDASALTADHAHTLQATLHDGDGALRWTTKAPHTVEIGSEAEAGPITLVLEPVTDGVTDDESLQDAQQEMLEPAADAGTTSNEADGERMEEIDEKATEMQEPTETSKTGTTATQ